MLPRLSLALPSPPARLDPRTAFDAGLDDIWLEVGFGAGEHLAAQAEAHANVGLIGCESYVNGVASLVKLVADKELGNVRVFADDAGLVIEALVEASIGRAFVLFPDPWPKARHRKRRFIAGPTVGAFAHILKNGAELRVATDDPEYCRWTLAHVLGDGAFEWPALGPSDWRNRPADWPATRYERKSAAFGRPPIYLTFRRLTRR